MRRFSALVRIHFTTGLPRFSLSSAPRWLTGLAFRSSDGFRIHSREDRWLDQMVVFKGYEAGRKWKRSAVRDTSSEISLRIEHDVKVPTGLPEYISDIDEEQIKMFLVTMPGTTITAYLLERKPERASRCLASCKLCFPLNLGWCSRFHSCACCESDTRWVHRQKSPQAQCWFVFLSSQL